MTTIPRRSDYHVHIPPGLHTYSFVHRYTTLLPFPLPLLHCSTYRLARSLPTVRRLPSRLHTATTALLPFAVAHAITYAWTPVRTFATATPFCTTPPFIAASADACCRPQHFFGHCHCCIPAYLYLTPAFWHAFLPQHTCPTCPPLSHLPAMPWLPYTCHPTCYLPPHSWCHLEGLNMGTGHYKQRFSSFLVGSGLRYLPYH